MFMFKKQRTATTIILDRISALTNNQLAVTSIWQPRHATNTLATTLSQATIISTDPLDQALTAYSQSHGATLSHYQPLRQFDFTQQQGMSGNLWHNGGDYNLAVKGLPETVIAHCDLSDNERESITLQLHALCKDGGYVVAVGRATIKKPIKSLSELSAGHSLQFVGFVILDVTMAHSTKTLLTQAVASGVKPYILTGQHPVAGFHLASQLGLAARPQDVLDASRLDVMTDEQATVALRSLRVVARADPDQKARIIKLLRHIDPTAATIDTLDGLQHALNVKK